ncbi:MAG: hypothetical protein KDD82_31605, partial [Planctomycetes bacterium]|nr:hypothetical protein [Planctomycetota bacterium]
MNVFSPPQAGDWGPCPGPEALAAWLDGDRRRDLTEHLLGCADCRADALAAQRAQRGRSIERALERLATEVEPALLAGPCPGPVVVAAWTGGQRSPGLLEHWADCAPCRADLLAAARVELERSLEAALEAQPWREEAAVAGPCPSPDAIAVRVEAGDLTGLEDHLARCAPCRADALAAAEALAASQSLVRAAPPARLRAPDPALDAEVEPELAKVLSFSRRSRRLRRIVPAAPQPVSGFTPALAVAAAVLLSVCVFALRPRAHVDVVAVQDVDSARFAWAPEDPPAPRL